MTDAGPTSQDIVKVMAATIARYHRGEIDERTAWRETSMLKALMDGLTKAAPEAPPLTLEQARERREELARQKAALLRGEQ